MMNGNQIINYPKKTMQPTIISFVGKRQTHTLSNTPNYHEFSTVTSQYSK